MQVGIFLIISLSHLTRVKRNSHNIVRKSFLNNQLKSLQDEVLLTCIEHLTEKKESQLQCKVVLFLFSSQNPRNSSSLSNPLIVFKKKCEFNMFLKTDTFRITRYLVAKEDLDPDFLNFWSSRAHFVPGCVFENV